MSPAAKTSFKKPTSSAASPEERLAIANLDALRNTVRIPAGEVFASVLALDTQLHQYGLQESTGVRKITFSPGKSTQSSLNQSSPNHYRPARPKTDLGELEVLCARRFNFELPEALDKAVVALEDAVKDLMGCQTCHILVFDETTGIYTSLSDESSPDKKPRELTRIADTFLQELVGTPLIIHSHLKLGEQLVGLVAVANKPDGSPFFINDEITLELMAPYLASKVLRVQSGKHAMALPLKQDILIDLSSRLIAAVDEESIIAETLDILWSRLGFNAGQFSILDERTGTGTVLYEASNGRFKSYAHAGLISKRHIVKEYAGIISLLGSGWRKQHYLKIASDHLGDKPLGQVFGLKLKKIAGTLVVPITELHTGKIIGSINLFKSESMSISEDNIELVVTIAHLVSNALSRATVLEKALALATMDELTSLLNRRGMYERFESEIERARRHHTPITVALIDVDHFKKFNDTYGHLSGDLILKAIGSVFSKSVRKSDVVCRFGGEEFAILLPDTPTQPAYDLLERLRRKIEQMSVRGFNGETLKVTVSIGLASVDIASNITISAQVGQSGAEGNPASNEPNTAAFNSDEDNNRLIISEALAQADEKLYLAKSKGRNQVCCRED